MTQPSERTKLVNHIRNCREMLGFIKDEARRKLIEELIAYLEGMLARIDNKP